MTKASPVKIEPISAVDPPKLEGSTHKRSTSSNLFEQTPEKRYARKTKDYFFNIVPT